jgi:hypothetical protein
MRKIKERMSGSFPLPFMNRDNLVVHPVDREKKFSAPISPGPQAQQKEEPLGAEICKDNQIRPDLRIDFIKPPGNFRRIDQMMHLSWQDRRSFDKKEANLPIIGSVNRRVIIFRLPGQKIDLMAVMLKESGKAFELGADPPIVERDQLTGYNEDGLYGHMNKINRRL